MRSRAWHICFHLKMILLVYSVTVPEYSDTSQIWMTLIFLKTMKQFSIVFHRSFTVSSEGKGHYSVKSYKMDSSVCVCVWKCLWGHPFSVFLKCFLQCGYFTLHMQANTGLCQTASARGQSKPWNKRLLEQYDQTASPFLVKLCMQDHPACSIWFTIVHSIIHGC